MTKEELRDALRATDLTAAAIADRLGASTVTVQKWRQGRRAPCCKFMRRELEQLLAGKVKKGKKS